MDKIILFRLLLCKCLFNISYLHAQFKIIEGIPHLPVATTSVTDVYSPTVVGSMVFCDADNKIYIYDGNNWMDICERDETVTGAGAGTEFGIKNGISSLLIGNYSALSTSVDNLYFSSTENALIVHDGTSFKGLPGLPCKIAMFHSD